MACARGVHHAPVVVMCGRAVLVVLWCARDLIVVCACPCSWCVYLVFVLCARAVFVVCVRARAVLCLFVGGAHNVLLLTFFLLPPSYYVCELHTYIIDLCYY